jgi:hypothetical protein
MITPAFPGIDAKLCVVPETGRAKLQAKAVRGSSAGKQGPAP